VATRVAMTVWQAHDDPPDLGRLVDEAFAHLANGLAR